VKVIRDVAGQPTPLVITRDGMGKAVIQDVASQEEILALLRILAIGNQQVARGMTKPVAAVMKRLRLQSPDEFRQRG
jgi:hypothetical protein